MPTTTGGRGHHEGRDIVAAGRVAVVGAVERVAQAVHEAVGGAAEGDGVGAGRQHAGAGIEVGAGEIAGFDKGDRLSLGSMISEPWIEICGAPGRSAARRRAPPPLLAS